MTLKDGMNKWLDNKNPAIKEWVEPVKKFSEKDEVRGLIMKMVEDYENKKIDEAELLGSIANMSGKTLEEIEQILVETLKTDETPKPSDGLQILATDVGNAIAYTQMHKPAPDEYVYGKWMGEEDDDLIWQLITRDMNQNFPIDSLDVPFVILVPTQNGFSRYLPINGKDSRWLQLLAKLERRRRKTND